MSPRILGFRLFALVGLAFAAALVADDLSQTPTFCSFENGCAAVTSSYFGRPLGIPLSAAGLLAFAGFFLLTLFPKSMARVAGPLALAAGTCGILLAGVQFLILQQLCQLCLVVDGAAVLLAAVELGFPARPAKSQEKFLSRWAWGVAAFSVATLPLAWAAFRPPPPVPPEVVQTWWSGKINIVEITSFTCPYCRKTHEALETLRKNQGDQLHFVRFVATSPKSKDALAAARAYLCAVRQRSGEIMADGLFKMDDYSPDKLHEIAARIGLDLARFDADWKDPSLDEEMALTREWVNRQQFAGVPQIWVQDMLLLGEQSPEQLLAAVYRVAPRRGE